MFKKMKDKINTFIRKIKSITRASYKELDLTEKVIKTVLAIIGIVIVVSIVMAIGFFILMVYIFAVTASAIGGGVGDGMNEAMGRNKYRRF